MSDITDHIVNPNNKVGVSQAWVDLNIELPPDKKTVLVCTAKGAVYTCRLPVIIQKNSRPEGFEYEVERFTHWMHLPNPPAAV